MNIEFSPYATRQIRIQSYEISNSSPIEYDPYGDFEDSCVIPRNDHKNQNYLNQEMQKYQNLKPSNLEEVKEKNSPENNQRRPAFHKTDSSLESFDLQIQREAANKLKKWTRSGTNHFSSKIAQDCTCKEQDKSDNLRRQRGQPCLKCDPLMADKTEFGSDKKQQEKMSKTSQNFRSFKDFEEKNIKNLNKKHYQF